jgi:hypothetical protein
MQAIPEPAEKNWAMSGRAEPGGAAMPDSLYETDVLAWSEHQADLLRRLAHGDRLNETIDWENVIEEVESVGRSELHSCESLLRQALIHLLKLHLWPDSDAAAHRAAEVLGFLADAQHSFSPSMRQRIDLSWLYRIALRQAQVEAKGQPVPDLPLTCPFVLDDLLNDGSDVIELVAKVGGKVPE